MAFVTKSLMCIDSCIWLTMLINRVPKLPWRRPTHAPIYAEMKGKAKGDKVEFNGLRYQILDVY
jgi:hypothetical protein